MIRKWATKQNIKYLQGISDLIINQGKTLKEIEEINTKEHKFYQRIESKVTETDRTLHDLAKRAF